MDHHPPARLTRRAAEEADRRSPLHHLRARFLLPDGVRYLDGNSLGALPAVVPSRLRQSVEHDWGRGLIRSWNDADWVGLPARVGARLAPLIGADAREVVVADSTSVNLFKALVSARRLRPDRRVVLTDDANFPTDRYVADGVADLLADTEVVAVAPAQVADRLDTDVAVLALTHVDYRTGARFDAAALTAAAHAAGALTLWDLSHSAGAVEVDLRGWGADFAVGCTYKYLNGGPGSPAYLFVADRHHEAAASPIPGWFGHRDPFRFGVDYQPADGATRFAAGTPNVLSLVALEAALTVWEGVEIADLSAQAAALTARFIDLVDDHLGEAVELVTPRDAQQRGAQVALRHPQAHAVMQALIDRNVIGDHRPPDLLRFGLAPLYVRHVDVHDSVEVLAEVLADRAWDHPGYRRRGRVP